MVEHGAGVGGFQFPEGQVVGGNDGYRVQRDQFFKQPARTRLLVAGVGAAQDLVEHYQGAGIGLQVFNDLPDPQQLGIEIGFVVGERVLDLDAGKGYRRA